MFRLSVPDNGLHFFEDRVDLPRCSVCGRLTKKWDEDLSSVPTSPRRKYDVSYSYDGVLVVTARFRDAVIEDEVSGMEFRPLQGASLVRARR
jgi:hypothetical protein